MIEKMCCIVLLYSDENNCIIPQCLTNNISLSLSHLNNTLLSVFFFLRSIFSVYEMKINKWEWHGESIDLEQTPAGQEQFHTHLYLFHRTRCEYGYSTNICFWAWLNPLLSVWRHSEYATYPQTHVAGSAIK